MPGVPKQSEVYAVVPQGRDCGIDLTVIQRLERPFQVSLSSKCSQGSMAIVKS
jgi:hypothetical protein